MISDEEIEALRKLERAATPEPWFVRDDIGSIHDSSGLPIKTGGILCDGEGYSNSKLICAARSAIPKLLDEVERLRNSKDNAYRERNKCVIAFAKLAMKLGLQASVCQHDPNDKEWEDDWRTVVYIDLPVGQVSWHFHDSEKHITDWMPHGKVVWDGHTTDEKYDRLMRLDLCWKDSELERIKAREKILVEALESFLQADEDVSMMVRHVCREALQRVEEMK